MATYVESTLTKGEQVAYQGKVSLFSLAPLFLLGLVLISVYGLGLLFWIAAAIRYFTTELAITNKRVIAKFGLISRSTIEINLQKIESIQVNQGILGRIFNYGSIVVSGAGNPQAPVPGISNPLQFRRAFIDTQETNGQPQPVAQPA
ncbi:MAG: PH domain-containing protein [Proteobacteria bacterium]|nr:PH domain-containing protein [Pseudomonadota bacterium]